MGEACISIINIALVECVSLCCWKLSLSHGFEILKFYTKHLQYFDESNGEPLGRRGSEPNDDTLLDEGWKLSVTGLGGLDERSPGTSGESDGVEGNNQYSGHRNDEWAQGNVVKPLNHHCSHNLSSTEHRITLYPSPLYRSSESLMEGLD
jgi:hypothetical protein